MGIFDNLYEWQKKQIKEVQEELTPVAKDLIANIYAGQKEILQKAQDRTVSLAKAEYSKSVGAVYDRLVNIIKKKGFIGKLVALFLKKYKGDIIGKLVV